MLRLAIGVLACAVLATVALGHPSSSLEVLFTPANDPNPGARAAALGLRQALFTSQSLKDAGLTNVPDYAINVTVPAGFLGSNDLTAEENNLLDSIYSTLIPEGATQAAAILLNTTLNTLDDFENLYTIWGITPVGLENWRTDAHFGRLRKTFYPRFLKLTTVLPAFVPAGTVSTFDLAAQRIYDVDYAAELTGVDPKSTKFGTPYALFKQANPRLASSPLLPIGIYLQGVWYTPADGAAWLLAKIACNGLEANLNFAEHGLESHMIMSAVAVATERQLYGNTVGDPAVPVHPVHAIIAQSLKTNIPLNGFGFPAVFNIGTTYDLSSALGSAAVHRLVNRDWASLTWEQRYFDFGIASRGLTNLAGFDYATDLYAYEYAIRARVNSFLAKYYSHDSEVAADTEIQAWAADIGTNGHVYGFPSPIATQQTLEDVLTHILMHVPRHHADASAIYPNAQLVLPYAPWKFYDTCSFPATAADKAGVTEAFIVQKCMPKLVDAVGTLAHAIGFMRPFGPEYTLLDSGNTAPTGNRDQHSRDGYTSDLTAISEDIQSRPTAGVTLPYVLLDPAQLSNTCFN